MAAQGAGNNELAMTYLKEALSIYKIIKSPKLQKLQEVIDALGKGIPYDAKHQFE